MRSLSALVIASFIATSPVALAEDGSEHYDQMLQRVAGQSSAATIEHQAKTAAEEERKNS
jgi:hypothetical protein